MFVIVIAIGQKRFLRAELGRPDPLILTPPHPQLPQGSQETRNAVVFEDLGNFSPLQKWFFYFFIIHFLVYKIL